MTSPCVGDLSSGGEESALNIWVAFEYFCQHLHDNWVLQLSRKAGEAETQDRSQLLLYNYIFNLDR